MKTIGLIGGITWQSTIMYYEVLNRLAAQHYGEPASAKCIIYSVDFSLIKKNQQEGNWKKLNDIMAEAGRSLELAGAKQILICANTMHLCIDAIRSAVDVPVIHIAEATALQIKKNKLSTVALLGTKYTMEKDFFKTILKSHGLTTIVPSEQDREEVHRVIYEELSKGELLSSSKDAYIKIINKMADQGAQGVILGCTEIPLLIKQEDVSIPVFDTTTIHSNAGFSLAIA